MRKKMWKVLDILKPWGDNKIRKVWKSVCLLFSGCFSAVSSFSVRERHWNRKRWPFY